MKLKHNFLLLVCGLVLAFPGNARAQSDGQLQLGLSRDFGYDGFGNDIQGIFTMRVKDAPDGLTRVVFLIDGAPIYEDAESPYSVQFNTDSYPLGIHTLSATGYTSNETQLSSNAIVVEFVPANAATQMILKFIVPFVGLIVLISLLSIGLPMLLSKGKASSLTLGTPRKYGIGGGAICPRCRRPFPLRLWFINLGWNKIDRCPYCGKWSFLRPRSLEELRAAEAAELSLAGAGNPPVEGSEADRLKKDLDNSRFQDL